MSKFFKYQSLGNDYLVIDPKHWKLPLSARLIKTICDRHFGIGSDGILYGPLYNSKDKKIPRVKIYNPDGSEAEKSGNGARIFAKYLYDQRYVSSKKFSFMTISGIVNVDINNNNATEMSINLGKLQFNPQKDIKNVIIKNKKYSFNIASIGNPHCVIILPKISVNLAKKLGLVIEYHDLFPDRTNVQFVKILDKNTIQIEIWERGAGYTLASGTSSAAAAGVCHKLGLCDKTIKVVMPGGKVQVTIKPNLEIFQTGDVHKIYEGIISNELINSIFYK